MPLHTGTHTHTEGTKVIGRVITHQDIGSNDIRIITDRFHKEYLAMERKE
jgi:hypothetical protein